MIALKLVKRKHKKQIKKKGMEWKEERAIG